MQDSTPTSNPVVRGRSIADILELHAAWLQGGPGERAVLRNLTLNDIEMAMRTCGMPISVRPPCWMQIWAVAICPARRSPDAISSGQC